MKELLLRVYSELFFCCCVLFGPDIFFFLSSSGAPSLTALLIRLIECGARHLPTARACAAGDGDAAPSLSRIDTKQSSTSTSTSGGGGGGGSGTAIIGNSATSFAVFDTATLNADDATSVARVVREFGNAIAFEATIYQSVRALELALRHEPQWSALLASGGTVGITPIGDQLLRRGGAGVIALAALLARQQPTRIALHATRVLTLLCTQQQYAARVVAVLANARLMPQLIAAIDARVKFCFD